MKKNCFLKLQILEMYCCTFQEQQQHGVEREIALTDCISCWGRRTTHMYIQHSKHPVRFSKFTFQWDRILVLHHINDIPDIKHHSLAGCVDSKWKRRNYSTAREGACIWEAKNGKFLLLWNGIVLYINVFAHTRLLSRTHVQKAVNCLRFNANQCGTSYNVDGRL